MAKQIYLTFKSNEEDEQLYEWICKHSNKSGFIKDAMREKMIEEELKKVKDKNGIYTVK